MPRDLAWAIGPSLTVPQSRVTEQRGAVVDQLVDSGDVGAIALEDAVGDVDLRIEPEMAEIARHEGAGRSAIDIVVAEQRDLLVVGDGSDETRGEDVHVGQRRRVGHQSADGGVEVLRGCFDADAARRR